MGGLDARASAAGHRLRAATTPAEIADAVATTCDVAADLVAARLQPRAAGLLPEAEQVATACVELPELRARVGLHLADVLTWLADLDRALTRYEEAADLARSSTDPVLRARAEIGANLCASAFVPDLPLMRRLEEVLRTFPAEERHLRATLLGRLTMSVAPTSTRPTGCGRGPTLEDAAISNAQGDVVWDATTFGFLSADAPTSVNPSLWRRSSLPPVAPAHSALSTRRRRIVSALEVHVDENS